jgi:EpsI family protein
MNRVGLLTPSQRPSNPSAVAPPADRKPVLLTRAIWTAVAVVAVLQGGSIAIERSFFPSAVRSSHHQLSELPLTLGHWTGTEVTLDPKTFAAVGAQDQIARIYKNSSGGIDSVSVHSAAFISQDDWTPHLPEVCYSANGWELLQSRTVSLPGSPSVRVALQTYQQPAQRVVVVYWYQMDQGTFSDREGGRKLRRGQWGRRARSPLLKTILQTGESDRAEAELLEIAAKIYEFNCRL